MVNATPNHTSASDASHDPKTPSFDAQAKVPPAPRHRGTWVAALSIALGLLLILGLSGLAFWAMFGRLGESYVTSSTSAPVAERVIVDAKSAEVTLRYEGTAPEAIVFAEARTESETLPVTVEGDANELRVRIEGDGGFLSFPDDLKVQITLPASAASTADVQVHVGSGFARVDSPVETLRAKAESGVFEATGAKDAVVEFGSGMMSLTGHYETLEMRGGSGVAEFQGQVLLNGRFEVTSGVGNVDLSGPMPAELTASVQSGVFDLTVPGGTYQVASSGPVDIDPRINPKGGADTPKVYLSATSGFLGLHAH